MIRNIKGYDKPQRIVVVERTMRFLMAYDPEYHPVDDPGSIEFHLNCSCHCADNEIDSLHWVRHAVGEAMPYGCNSQNSKVIKDATPEDLEHYPRTFYLPDDPDPKGDEDEHSEGNL